MNQTINSKVALITGAAHGQGRATAIALAHEGYHIAALDIGHNVGYPSYNMGSNDDLVSLGTECESIGVKFLALLADVSKADEVEAAVTKMIDVLGRVDVLFNNAGICAYGLTHEITEAEFDRMIDVNLKGSWLMAKYVIPHLITQKSGVIINNSSVGGLRGMNRLSHYAATKWALTGLTKSWALELAPHNIRVISIHPTGVNTPMNDGLAEMEGKTPQEIGEASAGNLLPVPWIEPEDVAQAVVYLTSEKARFITGSQLVLDAGLLTR
jgi:NAD(P)-dependent dehydrogenase (short-subunit alcohol dehydrogenase family)